MWTWKVTFQSVETGEVHIVFGSDYPNQELARWSLANYLRDRMAGVYYGIYKHKILEAIVVYASEKETNEGTCLQER